MIIHEHAEPLIQLLGVLRVWVHAYVVHVAAHQEKTAAAESAGVHRQAETERSARARALSLLRIHAHPLGGIKVRDVIVREAAEHVLEFLSHAIPDLIHADLALRRHADGLSREFGRPRFKSSALVSLYVMTPSQRKGAGGQLPAQRRLPRGRSPLCWLATVWCKLVHEASCRGTASSYQPAPRASSFAPLTPG